MKRLSLMGLLMALSFCAHSQAPDLELQPDRRLKDSTRKAEAVKIAIEKRIPLRLVSPDGRLAEFMGFHEDGTPLYYITDNRDAAKTISTNKLYNGGGLGLSLNGDSMTIGEWDGGKVRNTHQELNGRVTQVDGASSNSDHATHVAGTLIGGGFQSTAKGMAFLAKLNAYDWDLDVSEMTQAAQNGLLISNHSYGQICGWYENKDSSWWEWYGDTSISATEDWKYGYYNSQARDWDDLAYNHPGYLIVKAAGNDRGAKLPSGVTTHKVWNNMSGWVTSSATRATVGQYDCIAAAGVSKNVLTVGAVDAITNGYFQASDVVMSTFSGWGPTDDGRIKPDIVANGVGVYSSTAGSNTSYATYNGTSMATPSVSGSLLLVQQHYKKLKNSYMKSATLKGLVIHTADEAGTADGPDYIFGWGLMNAASCVNSISNTNSNRIIEAKLNNLTSYEISLYNDGTTPLWATICWTDKKGNPPGASLDPVTKMLVNDLDLRIIRVSDNQVFNPWILDPANPANAAITGDNIRDNVEKVTLKNPQAGFYKIRITHKGALSGLTAQNFSLIISGESPGLKADFTSNTDSVCAGMSVKYSPVLLGTPTSYQWNFPGGSPSSSSDSSPVVIYAAAGRYDAKLRISNPATADSISRSNYMTVHPKPGGTWNISGGPYYCDNDADTVTLTASGSLNTSFSGKGVSGTFFSPVTAGAGIHWLKVHFSDQFGCLTTDSFGVYVKKSPAKPLISQSGDSLSSSISTSYQWYLNNIIISGADKSLFQPSQSGKYIVGIKDSTGCETRSDAYDFIKSGLAGLSFFSAYYPNPASESVILSFSEAVKIRVTLTSAEGKMLKFEELSGNAISIDVSGLEQGLYFMILENEGGKATLPLLISR